MPAGAIYVGRPTKWGNPFRAFQASNGKWFVVDDNGVDYTEPPDGWSLKVYAAAKAAGLFLMDVKGELAPYPPLSELRGHDLVCWCPLDQPCHADVLLELANTGTVR